MASFETSSIAGPSVLAKGALWRGEIAETMKLAAPMAATQLGQIAMMTTDLALLGRLGDHVVAGAALAHTVLFAAYTLGMGLVAAVAPLASQAFGARQPRLVRRSVRVGLWAALLAGVPLTALQMWGDDILVALGQPAETAALAGRYLAGLAWCLVPSWAFIALRNFMSALNRPEPALWITLAAIPLNAALAYALIYGAFGAPRLDILGAGVATTLVNVAMCAAAVWFAYARHPFKKYRVLGRFWRADWVLFRQLLVVGMPISGAFLLEFGLFAAASLLMGRIGPHALAAHAIALQIAAILFMVPFGISLAATVRVGQAAGRGDAPGTRRAGLAAMALAALFMAAMTLVVVLFRHAVPQLFLGAGSEARPRRPPWRSPPPFWRSAQRSSSPTASRRSRPVRSGGSTARALADRRLQLLGRRLRRYGRPPRRRGRLDRALGRHNGLLLLGWRFHALTRAGYMPAVAGTT